MRTTSNGSVGRKMTLRPMSESRLSSGEWQQPPKSTALQRHLIMTTSLAILVQVLPAPQTLPSEKQNEVGWLLQKGGFILTVQVQTSEIKV